MRILRLGILVTGCLALGLVAGQRLPRPSAPSPAAPVPVAIAGAASATTLSQTESSTTTTRTTPVGPTGQSADPTVAERLATLRWLKGKGMNVSITLFNDEGLTPQFALLYGLTESETAQLNQAYKRAQQRLEELALQAARLDPSSTAGKLVVAVPPFPAEGGQTYSALLATFSAVLGDERSAVFNQLSGDAFERALGSFGLENTHYEVAPQEMVKGRQLYSIHRSFTLPDGSGGTRSGGTLTGAGFAEDLAKFHPVLKSFPLPTTVAPSSQ